jgi:hypothetical protein
VAQLHAHLAGEAGLTWREGYTGKAQSGGGPRGVARAAAPPREAEGTEAKGDPVVHQ